MLAKDTLNAYMVYRFGTKNKIEFKYPNNLKESCKKFKYSFYMRGGGAMNEGMELNYIYFEYKGFTYIIYDTYYAVGEKSNAWESKLLIQKQKKSTNIVGNIKTRKGTLTDFRDNHLLEITDELL